MKVKELEAGARPVSFLCTATLKRDIEMVAALDGISRADVIRRAVLADVRRRKQEALTSAERSAIACELMVGSGSLSRQHERRAAPPVRSKPDFDPWEG